MDGGDLYIAERGVVDAGSKVVRLPDEDKVEIVSGNSAVQHPLTPDEAILQRGRKTTNRRVGIIGRIPGQHELKKAAEDALGRPFFSDVDFVCYPPEDAVVKGALEILADLIPAIPGRHALTIERPGPTNFSSKSVQHQPELVFEAAPPLAASEPAKVPEVVDKDAAVERRKRDRAIAAAETELRQLSKLLQEREGITNRSIRMKLVRQAKEKIEAKVEALNILQKMVV